MERTEKETYPTEINSNVIVRRAAEIDIIEAFAGYEEQQKDLGIEFLNSTDKRCSPSKQTPALINSFTKIFAVYCCADFLTRYFILLKKRKLLFSAVSTKNVVRING